MTSDRPPYSWLEAEALKDGAPLLAGGKGSVDAVCEAIARLMEPLSVPPCDPDAPTPEYWKKTAVLNAAAIAVRNARAGSLLVRHGYAPEALGHLRAVSEALNVVVFVTATEEPDRARQWVLSGRTSRKPKDVAAIAGQLLGDPLREEAFHRVSKRVHATSRAAQLYHAARDIDDRVPVTAVPEHRVRFSGSVLFALMTELVLLHGELAKAWQVPSEDPAIKSLRQVQQIDGPRHTSIHDLLGDTDPYTTASAAD